MMSQDPFSSTAALQVAPPNKKKRKEKSKPQLQAQDYGRYIELENGVAFSTLPDPHLVADELCCGFSIPSLLQPSSSRGGGNVTTDRCDV